MVCCGGAVRLPNVMFLHQANLVLLDGPLRHCLIESGVCVGSCSLTDCRQRTACRLLPQTVFVTESKVARLTSSRRPVELACYRSLHRLLCMLPFKGTGSSSTSNCLAEVPHTATASQRLAHVAAPGVSYCCSVGPTLACCCRDGHCERCLCSNQAKVQS
jgi:hypothetical protein